MKKKIKFSTLFSFAQFKENKYWHVLLLVLLPAIIYIQSVKFDYTNFDDNGIIRDKFEIVGNIKNVDTLLKVDAFFNATGDFYRPVQNLTFMLDAQVSRDKLWMFHITNLIIHILTGISLYFFLQMLGLRRFTAFVMALLFSVHPLFASGVGWVPSRGDILIGLEGILLFITFHKYFTGNKKLLWFILHSLLFTVTVFTKETTIFFPLLLVFYYCLVLQKPSDFKLWKYIKRLLPYGIIWLAATVIYFYLRRQVSSNTGATQDVLGIIPFFKNNTVIPTIIGKFFIPFRLSTFPLYDNISTIIGLLFLLGILYISFEYSVQKKWSVLMGLLWFGLFAIPPTIYRLENADVFFNYLEHRTYLPMIGIVIVVGFYINDKLTEETFKKYFYRLYIPVIILFAALSWIHCADYTDMFTLRARAAKLNNPSAIAGVAGEFLGKGDTTAALENINKAIRLNPKDPSMLFERGKIMSRMQLHEEAEQDFSLALTMRPNAVDALLARSVERRILKKYQSAFRDIFQAASIDSANPKIYYSFGNLFIATKNYNDAIGAFSKCISLQPKFGEAYNNRAYTKIQIADFAGAISDCDSAQKLIPSNPIVYNNKGQAYKELKNADSAFLYFNKAIDLKKDFAEGFFERGRAKQFFNDKEGACKDWTEAKRLGYKDTTSLLEKNCTLYYK